MEKKIYSFLNSDLNEVEFYNLPKEELLTLKEYLLFLNEKDEMFKKNIQKPFNSIKEKCAWIKKISFDGLQSKTTGKIYPSSVYLYGMDKINLIITFNDLSGQYEDLAKDVPLIYHISKNVRTRIKRQDEVKFIQSELGEIDTIGKEIYENLLYTPSISGNFDIYYSPYVGLYLYNNYILMAKYLNNPRNYLEKEILKSDDKKRILTKIQIKYK